MYVYVYVYSYVTVYVYVYVYVCDVCVCICACSLHPNNHIYHIDKLLTVQLIKSTHYVSVVQSNIH